MRKVCAERPIGRAISIAVLGLLASTPALAATGAHHDSGHGAAILIPYWINFTLYAALLFVLLRKPLSRGWSSRRDTIAAAVDRGRSERERAEAALRIAKEREAAVESDIRALVAQIQSETSAEMSEILKEARERAGRVIVQGRDLIAAEERALESELRRELADEVLKRAADLLKQRVDPSLDATLRASSLKNVPQLLQ